MRCLVAVGFCYIDQASPSRLEQHVSIWKAPSLSHVDVCYIPKHGLAGAQDYSQKACMQAHAQGSIHTKGGKLPATRNHLPG